MTYLAIALGVFIRGSWRWIRAYDRFYPLTWPTIAREWAGITLKSAVWPLIVAGACIGGAIDGVRWVWVYRSNRKRKVFDGDVCGWKRYEYLPRDDGRVRSLLVRSWRKDGTTNEAIFFSDIRVGQDHPDGPAMRVKSIHSTRVNGSKRDFIVTVEYERAYVFPTGTKNNPAPCTGSTNTDDHYFAHSTARFGPHCLFCDVSWFDIKDVARPSPAPPPRGA